MSAPRMAKVVAAVFAAATLGGAALPASGQAAITTGTKIMPLGDSITYGYKTGGTCPNPGTEGGYRAGLYSLFAGAGITPDFVGSLSSGASTGARALPDKDHEGHCGERIDQVDGTGGATIASYITAAQPDVVLLHLGTNDVNQDNATYPAATAPSRLSALINHILAARPGVSIYVASLVPATTTTVEARVATFNQAIPGIVDAKVAAGKDVHYVNLHDAVRTAQFVDTLHPNDSGYDAMAQAWFGALTGTKQSLVLGGGFEDQLTTGLTSPWSPQSSAAGGSFGNDRYVPAKTRTGDVNGWIATSGTEWNALTQTITVRANTSYRMTVWLRNSGNFTSGWLGVKTTSGVVINEINHGAQTTNYGQYTVDFNSGARTSVVLHVGYWGPGTSSWEQVDDVSIVPL